MSNEVLTYVKNQEISADSRAEFLSAMIQQNHSGAKLAAKNLIERNDKFGGVTELLEAMDTGPQRTEYLLDRNGIMATITDGERTLHAPSTGDTQKLPLGSAVRFAVKAGVVLGSDEHAISSGRVCVVRSIINDGTQAVVELRGEGVVYHCHENVRGKLVTGDKVITDEVAKIVVQVLEKTNSGDVLLTSMDILDGIDVSKLADLNPAVEDILFRCRAYVDHAEWMEVLDVRASCSYLFCGPTGTGKTTALNIVARKLSDHVEHLTGKRVSRLVRADTSTFFTSYFGETEQRIKAWFEGLKNLGKEKLLDADGNEVKVPILVVMEEGEALFRSRSDGDASSHLFDRPLSLMLSQASSVGAEIETPIIIVMTSNRPSLIDAAALRRFGMRRVDFSGLSRDQAAQVLDKRIAKKTPVREDSRDQHIQFVLEYLYGEEPDQRLCECNFSDGSQRFVERRHLVTPAIIEEAISQALDQCLRDSVKAGKLLGLCAVDVVRHLDKHFGAMAQMLKAKNLEEYIPQWFAEAGCCASSVKCLV